MLKTIIFDMDGVIINSEAQHNRAMMQVLESHGAKVDTGYHSRFVGTSTQKMAEICIQDLALDIDTDTLVQELKQAKKRILAEEGYQTMPGVIENIKSLAQEGIKLAIASSSSASEIENMMKALKIRKYFDCIISASRVEKPKPAPDLFNTALKEMGTNATEAMVIEDSTNGLEAAKNAGICCVGFLNPDSGEQDLKDADVILESFEGITPAFYYNIYQRSQGKPITIASTKRLLIRELIADDIEELYPIYQDPDVRRFIDDIDDYMDMEKAKQEAYIRNVYSFYGYGLWGVFSKTSGGLIGRCGIENHNVDGKQEIMLSYLLDSNHWGYGYALECCRAILDYALNELHIHRIVAVIDKANERSLHTAKNLGMEAEKELTYKGRDSILYSIKL